MSISEIQRRVLFTKHDDISYIIRAYETSRDAYLSSISNLNVSIPDSEAATLSEKLAEAGRALRVYYQDFFIHTIIFCDYLSNVLSEGGLESFPVNQRSLEQLPMQYRPAFAKFQPFQNKIRYWRNKLIIHKELELPAGGAIRSHPRGDIEFLASKWKEKFEPSDLEYMLMLRDRYSKDFPQLEKEVNFWELMVLFNNLNLPFSQDERDRLHSLRKEYGTFLPKIDPYVTAFQDFFTKLSLDLLPK